MVPNGLSQPAARQEHSAPLTMTKPSNQRQGAATTYTLAMNQEMTLSSCKRHRRVSMCALRLSMAPIGVCAMQHHRGRRTTMECSTTAFRAVRIRRWLLSISVRRTSQLTRVPFLCLGCVEARW